MMTSRAKATLVATCMLVATPIAAAANADTSEELVASFFDALSAKDFDQIEAMFTVDATVLLPFAAGQGTTASPVVFGGLEQIMGYYRGAGQRIASVGFTESEITASPQDDIVFVENVGDMVLPDGRDYQNRYVWRFIIEDGLFAEIREYYDPKVADTAFGRN